MGLNKRQCICCGVEYSNGSRILANSSTMLRYSEKNLEFRYFLGQISHQIGGYNSALVIFDSELTNLAFTIFERVRTRLEFMLRLNTILGFQYQASTQPRTQTFKIHFENKSRVKTPLGQNLMGAFSNTFCKHASKTKFRQSEGRLFQDRT